MLSSDDIQAVKLDEQGFYKKHTEHFFKTHAITDLSWQQFFSAYLHKPYRLYMSYIEKAIYPQSQVLDLCCGTGEFSFQIAQFSPKSLLGVDFSAESIACAQEKLKLSGLKHIEFQVGDVEKMDLKPQSIDLICISGSLAYLQTDILLSKIRQWLKPNGHFIVVDTYGYNPLFNVKRWLNYLFKFTTRQTLLGIPKKPTIDTIQACFEEFEIQYSGVFAFIGPFLKPIIGEKKAAKLIDRLDELCPFLKHWAFKITFSAGKPKPLPA